jgi:uncharacterized repeat protein (TIGR03837 family)
MRWDIFCQIVDNYGDAGICWRLARSLASHQQKIRLFCDDMATFKLIMTGAPPTSEIQVLPWEDSYSNARHPLESPDVVIEAFACELPTRYITGLLINPIKPLLINLEYLSAEAWVGDFHAKPSPQNNGLTKYFFFPGFQENTGGLLVDPLPELSSTTPSPPPSLSSIWSQLNPHAQRISIFCYPGAPLTEWLHHLNAIQLPMDILLAFGNAELLSLQNSKWANLNLISLPFLPQDDFDWLLRNSDFNIVRGEDSFVRAQLAAKPFIWNIYPQSDQVHEIKLDAFLDLYLKNADPKLSGIFRQAMRWDPPSRWWTYLGEWQKHAHAWNKTLRLSQADGGLSTRLLNFVK